MRRNDEIRMTNDDPARPLPGQPPEPSPEGSEARAMKILNEEWPQKGAGGAKKGKSVAPTFLNLLPKRRLFAAKVSEGLNEENRKSGSTSKSSPRRSPRLAEASGAGGLRRQSAFPAFLLSSFIKKIGGDGGRRIYE
jgi:hypothetical protein